MIRLMLWRMFRRYWAAVVSTWLAAAVITQLVTAHLWDNINCGMEILWEVPLIVALVVSAWLAVFVKDKGKVNEDIPANKDR